MKKILIADSSKASLVMTSEVFKDYYPGIQVLVAKTSEEALQLAKCSEGVDAFVIDFDLPDLNGAKTALLLKKLYETPILITAFDRPEVVHSIETSLHPYADCQSWLKKPVNPEVVIAVSQRFCEVKARAQKRVSCHLPVFAEVLLENESVVAFQQILLPQKSKKTDVKGGAKKTKEIKKVDKNAKDKKIVKGKKEVTTPIPIYFCGVIEDCSLSGVKLKPSKHGKSGLTDWNLLLASMDIISSGSSVTLKLPSHSDIESGSVLEISKISHIPNIAEGFPISQEKIKKSNLKEETSVAKGKKLQKKSSSLSTLSNVTKKKVVEKDLTHRIQSMVGKISWTSSESGEWCIGVEFENQNLSKRLFEAILAYQLKQQKNFPSQSVMKTSRAG
ncbi:response regulator [Fluviispira multicolorata]|uniref:Response regulator n=1 Tax=Fluviispira multicolorata TaxID=2654512 RepID=A0A833JAN0_9BACT|nr:response regulator [Fluviispira multicolorata]KAB8028064.1 response regulator [Fluviispira multicolorata]